MTRAKWIGIGSSLVSLALAYAFGLIWAVLLAGSVLAGWVLRWRNTPAVKVVVTGLALLVLGALYWAGGFLPDPTDLPTAAESRLPVLGPVASDVPAGIASANEVPKSTPLVDYRFDEDAARILSGARRVERTESLIFAATSVASAPAAKESSLDVSKLIGAIDALTDSVEEAELGSSEEIRGRVKELKTFLIEERRKLLGPDTTLFDREDFLRRARQLSMHPIPLHMTSVENELQEFGEQVVGSKLEVDQWLRAELKEKEGELWLERVVSIETGGLDLTSIDASDLVSTNIIREMRQEFLRDYDGLEQPQQLSDDEVAQIPVRKGVQSVQLVSRIVIPDSVQSMPRRLRAVAIPYFLLRWPNPLSKTLWMTVDLSSQELPELFPYGIKLDSTVPIREIRVPDHSFFSASYGFDVRTEADYDVLEPKNELAPSYFQTHKSLRVELLPRFFRNALVQRFRYYLYTENLVTGLIILFAGAIYGWVSKSPGKDQPSA